MYSEHRSDWSEHSGSIEQSDEGGIRKRHRSYLLRCSQGSNRLTGNAEASQRKDRFCSGTESNTGTF